MINALLTKIVGSKNERTLKRLRPMVDRINALEGETAALTDDQLRAKKAEFQGRLSQGDRRRLGETAQHAIVKASIERGDGAGHRRARSRIAHGAEHLGSPALT